jgi:pimeloyl-ACP methyl ester carboxylesterase
MLQTNVLTSNSSIRLRRANEGASEKVLMLHGLGGTGLNWKHLINSFDSSFDIVAPDFPGFGLSTPMANKKYHPKDFASSMAEVVINQFGSQKVHLFGNSHGGSVAVHFASMFPELTKSLTLISPALPDLFPQLSASPVILSAIPGVGEKLLEKYQELSMEERAKNTINQCFYDINYGEEIWLEDLLHEMKDREGQTYINELTLTTLRNLLKTYFDFSSTNPWQLAKTIKEQALFIYGAKDKLVHPKAAHVVHKYFENSKVLVLPRIGHVAHIEKPQAVRDFFYKHHFSNLLVTE